MGQLTPATETEKISQKDSDAMRASFPNKPPSPNYREGKFGSYIFYHSTMHPYMVHARPETLLP